MRRSAPLLLLALVVVGVASCNKAGPGGGGAKPAEIVAVRVGIPPGPLVGDEDAGRRTDTLFKAGHWAPVLVTIAGKSKIEDADLVVQTVDSDDVFNDYAVRLPVLDFSAEQPQFQVVTYVRPGKMESPVNVSLRVRGQTIAGPDKSYYALEPTFLLYTTLGGRLPGLQLPGLAEKHMRRSEIGALDKADELPRRWLGYNTIDLAILTTGNDEFMSGLLNDSDRRNALLEWVRRGGKLALFVGKNQGLLQNREDLKEFLPVDFMGTTSFDSDMSVRWGNTAITDLVDPAKKTPLTIAKLKAKPDRDVRELATVRAGEGEGQPFAVQAPYGLGRVTIIATDADQPPFNKWKKQGEFWEKMLRDAGPIYAEAKNDVNIGGIGDSSTTDLGWQLQRSLEQFDSVPVIQFGWVALFILIYILIVGPLDYLFLKKVVKRLELTWVTFPIVVIIVSAAAYFTAYALKGNDQRMKKIDLIDFDLTSQTAQGHTWFSIFSPRVQNYTIGVEPSTAWGLSKEPVSPPVVSWMARVSNARQSLFRRSYDYDTNAGGLQRVPIQVWSDKCFQATWHHKLDPANPPLTVDLQAVGNDLTGSITSNLPVELQNVTVFYRNNVYDLGTIAPGANHRRQVTPSNVTFDKWSSQNAGMAPQQQQPNQAPWMRQQQLVQAEPSANIVREVMFHEKFEEGQARSRTPRNAGVRELDESWRLGPSAAGASAIIYGTVALNQGPAADVIQAPGTVTRLWLGVLPGGDAAQRNLSGTMHQETHLRFYVPVKKADNQRAP
jgi:hypothetical protein